MIIRNAVNSILRTKGRSLLFLLLLTALTAFMSLGASVWNLAERMLAECDETFTTIAVLEYIGADYPDESVYDSELQSAIDDFPFWRMKHDPAVKTWDATVRALGYTPQYERMSGTIPLKERAVLYVHTLYKDPGDSGLYMGTIEPMYRFGNMKPCTVFIDPNGFDFVPERGHAYLMHGEFFHGRSALTAFRMLGFDSGAAEAAGIDCANLLPFEDVSEIRRTVRDDRTNVFVKMAEMYRVVNGSFSVYATADIDAFLTFHQGEQYLTRGRKFTNWEYTAGRPVCIVSEATAASLDVEIGDKIPLALVVNDDFPLYECYWPEDKPLKITEYEVVGVTNDTADFDQTIYIPKPIGLRGEPCVVGYTIAQARLDNGHGDDFVRRVSPLLTDRMRLTVYDQGYSAVAQPIEEVRETAVLVTLACMIAGAAVLLLFAYLFVYRQRETYEIFVFTGASTLDTIKYLLASCGLVALIGAGLGALGGYIFSDRLAVAMFGGAEAASVADLRFSTAGLGIVKDFSISTELEPSALVFILTGVTVFLICCLLCVGFMRLLFSERGKKKPGKKSAVKRLPAPKHSRPAGGALAYALTAIRRGGTRSLAAPAAALTIVVFISVISSTLAGYEARLDDVYNMEISGYATGLNGRSIGGLLMAEEDVAFIEDCEYITDVAVSSERTYLYAGVAMLDEQTENPSFLPPEVPSNGYLYETWYSSVLRGPSMVFTTGMTATPEFFFSGEIETEFMEGWDESFFSAPKATDGYYNCIVPRGMMERCEIRFGDIIELWEPIDSLITHRRFRVVGCFEQQSTEENIYCQLAALTGRTTLLGYDYHGIEYIITETMSYGSLKFSVTSPEALTPLKDILEDYGFSQIQRMSRVRTALVIDDDAFIESVSSLTKHISRLKALYPALFVLTMAIGFVVSYLLMLSRRGELAIMRLLGAQRVRTFLSFYLEQAILCIIGSAAALLLWRVFADYTPLQLRSAAIFVGCYFLGSALSVLVMNTTKVMAALAERE